MTGCSGASTVECLHLASDDKRDPDAEAVSKDEREQERREGLRRALADVGQFGEAVLRMPLRPYQLDVARAVARSVAERQGLTFTVMIVPRGYGHLRAVRQTASPAGPGPRPP